MRFIHYILPWALIMSSPLWNQQSNLLIKHNREHPTAVYIPIFVNIFKAKKQFNTRLPCLMPGRIRHINGDCYLSHRMPKEE